MPLEVAYSPSLVLCSLAVAIMASFTALRLTSSLRNLPSAQRKARVTQGALALGVGIWSMHFVGMLAVSLPIAISYDPLPTLGSALIAILVVGVALLTLHFGLRSKTRIYLAGTLTGLGIVGMHYLGMSAISANCVIAYNPFGILLAIGIGIASSIAAIELAYRARSLVNIAAGSVVLGLAISAMHYTAMFFTVFSVGANVEMIASPILNTEQLAMVVALSSFVLCGLFLLLAVPGDKQQAEVAAADGAAAGSIDPLRPDAPTAAAEEGEIVETPLAEVYSTASESVRNEPVKIPYERDKVMRFLPASAISVVRADGHYTWLSDGEEEMFCPWSISRIEKKLDPEQFFRSHRSFLVNRSRIEGIKRNGDKTFCVVSGKREVEIPVSRSRITDLRESLLAG